MLDGWPVPVLRRVPRLPGWEWPTNPPFTPLPLPSSVLQAGLGVPVLCRLLRGCLGRAVGGAPPATLTPGSPSQSAAPTDHVAVSQLILLQCPSLQRHQIRIVWKHAPADTVQAAAGGCCSGLPRQHPLRVAGSAQQLQELVRTIHQVLVCLCQLVQDLALGCRAWGIEWARGQRFWRELGMHPSLKASLQPHHGQSKAALVFSSPRTRVCCVAVLQQRGLQLQQDLLRRVAIRNQVCHSRLHPSKLPGARRRQQALHRRGGHRLTGAARRVHTTTRSG